MSSCLLVLVVLGIGLGVIALGIFLAVWTTNRDEQRDRENIKRWNREGR